MSEALKARQHVGKSYKKVDAATILSGRAAYTEDFVPPHASVSYTHLTLPTNSRV